MVRLTAKQKALYIFSALFTLVLLLIGRERITEMISGTTTEKVPVATLLQEFSAIPARSGDVWKVSPVSFDKGVITGVTAHLTSSAPAKEVLSYYSHALPPLGWESSNTAVGARDNKLKFCKAGVSLIVAVTGDDAGSAYYLGLAWSKFRQSPTYCARKVG